MKEITSKGLSAEMTMIHFLINHELGCLRENPRMEPRVAVVSLSTSRDGTASDDFANVRLFVGAGVDPAIFADDDLFQDAQDTAIQGIRDLLVKISEPSEHGNHKKTLKNSTAGILLAAQSPSALVSTVGPRPPDILCFTSRSRMKIDLTGGSAQYLTATDDDLTNTCEALFLNVFCQMGHFTFIFPFVQRYDGSVMIYEVDLPPDNIMHVLESMTPRECSRITQALWPA